VEGAHTDEQPIASSALARLPRRRIIIFERLTW
jgi:hypothetical protein